MPANPRQRNNEVVMAASILSLGCGEEDVVLLREVASMDDETPLVHTSHDLAQAQLWAGLHRPNLVVIDVRSFGRESLQFLKRFSVDPMCMHIPTLAIIDEYRRNDRADVLLAGATDLITTPIDAYECQARVLNLITL